jgi:hypothetical protein
MPMGIEISLSLGYVRRILRKTTHEKSQLKMSFIVEKPGIGSVACEHQE